MYDTITPEQWVIGLVISLLAFVGLVWLLWRYSPRTDGARDMSSAPTQPAAHAGTQVIHVPVLHTSSSERTSTTPAPGTEAAAPDTDVAEAGTEGWNTPRISTRLSDAETVALLAAQRGKDGKHRYSANQIHGLVGGARADVLAQVRQLREGAPAVFPPLSPEQQQLRRELQLER
jgi:hypothetical protein